jgi:aryl-alcohol dehydrogenase-like predicted oxidoreductase
MEISRYQDVCWERKKLLSISSLRMSNRTTIILRTSHLVLLTIRYDAVINAFDMASMYSGGDSELILGKALKELKIPREDVVPS